jgi:hypothetical protein
MGDRGPHSRIVDIRVSAVALATTPTQSLALLGEPADPRIAVDLVEDSSAVRPTFCADEQGSLGCPYADLSSECPAGAHYRARMARYVGEGAQVWRVRVELFAEDPIERVTAAWRSLDRMLPDDDGQQLRPPYNWSFAVDQGIGEASVVGFLFAVRADGLGTAAERAVDLARRVGGDCGVGPELFKVTLIPAEVVPVGQMEWYPPAET